MAPPLSAISGGVAVITGAASGIGRALSLNLAQRDATLALVDRNAEGLAETAAHCRRIGVSVSEHVLDMQDFAGLAHLPEDVIAAHGRATLLINNAGVSLAGLFEQYSLKDFEWLMAINFWAPVRLCHAFLPLLRTQPRAHIVNISSAFGLIAPPGQTAYCAAKFALRGFSESLRHELDGANIGVTVVHPGGVRTSIAVNSRIPEGADSAKLQEAAQKLEKYLSMPPEKAASIILKGVERGKKRILVGNDARMVDAVQRLAPANYWLAMKRSYDRERN